jgi:peptidoglycan/xylan/chitin deacetylase (PgdA/CDA1 family)
MLSAQHQALPRQVRLTFDDGPSTATTPSLLDQLKELGITATFFVVGRNIANTQGLAIIERMAAEGHQIGNHTYNHVHLTKLNAAQIEQEIRQTEELIGSLDNGIKLFRPPFGSYNAEVDHVVQALGYKSVFWNVDSLDWRDHYKNRRWVSHVLQQLEVMQDCTVLAHDIFPSTVAHFPELVVAMRKLSETEFAQVA